MRACTWALLVIALVSARARADSIYLNAEGQKNLDVLRLRIAPAVIFDDPLRKLPYIRCVVTGGRPAQVLSARYDTVEGSPEYEFIAFNAGGELRSAPVTISRSWVHHIDGDLDTDLDVRVLFSNRDELTGVALAGRSYFAMARRAADPQGTLGLWRNDVELPPEPAGVEEGAIVRFLLDPPLLDEGGKGEKWRARRDVENAAITKRIMETRPAVVYREPDARPSLLMPRLIEAIARERRFRLSRAGFDRTALAMLSFMLDLSTVKLGSPPNPDSPSDAISMEGSRCVVAAVNTILSAAPYSPGHGDPRELVELWHRYRNETDEGAKKQLGSEYEALQDRVAPPGRTSCYSHQDYCVDASESASVAIDGLMASEGLYYVGGYWRLLSEAAVLMHTAPLSPNPQKYARIDLREPMTKLIVRALHPPPTSDANAQRARDETREELGKQLYTILMDSSKPHEGCAVARKLLVAGGWGTPEQLREHTDTALDRAVKLAEPLLPPSLPNYDQHLAASREQARVHIATLRAIAELSGSKVEHERATATHLLECIEEMRTKFVARRQEDWRYGAFLELWSEPARSEPTRKEH